MLSNKRVKAIQIFVPCRAKSITYPGSMQTEGSHSAEAGSSPWVRGGLAEWRALGRTRVHSAAPV